MSNTLLIFIKNPEIGKIKTRLASSLGNEEALRIYKELLLYTNHITKNISFNKELYYSQYIDHKDHWNNTIYNKKIQSKGDLGLKMSNAFETAFAYSQKVVIIGSDCTQINEDIIINAFEQLNKVDVVFGPSLDGGYYLLGMNKFYPKLFENIQWSSPIVLQQSLEICKTLNLKAHLLEKLSDIDYEEDWLKYGW